MIKSSTVCVRLSEAELENLEDIAFWLQEQTGLEVSKSSALRWCLSSSHEKFLADRPK